MNRQPQTILECSSRTDPTAKSRLLLQAVEK